MPSASFMVTLAAAVAFWLLLRCLIPRERPGASESFEEAARSAAAEMEALSEALREFGRAVDDAIPVMRRLGELLSSRGRDA